jgi:hypothetical protein
MLVQNKQMNFSVKTSGLNYNKLLAYMFRRKVNIELYVKFIVLCNVTIGMCQSTAHNITEHCNLEFKCRIVRIRQNFA